MDAASETTKRKWTAEERRKLAAGDIDGAFAGPDNTFPIAGPGDVADAWGLAGHAEDPDAVRRRIIRIAKRYGWTGSLPQAAKDWAEEHGIDLSKAFDDLLTVKAFGGNRIGGYLVLWGDAGQRDLVGEYFTPRTAELDAVFKAMGRIPALYHHGMDATVRSGVVGAIDIMAADDVGLWVEAQLNKANEYADAIMGLVRKRALGWSSGTLPGARKVAPSGHIDRWPIVEGTLTPTPAEPRMRIELPVAEVKAAFADIGLEWETDTTLDGADNAAGDGADDKRAAGDDAQELGKGTEEVRPATADADRQQQIEIELERVALLTL